uniref:putative nuclease HARBI1 n=1 Tax=Pristiophorus japonicus TaxID=55135 RepID=UPI00398E4D7F
MSEEQCLRRLRFRKEVVTELCTLLRTYLAANISTRTSLSVAVKVTVALNFYQSPVGDICNISQFAVHCCIRQVTNALYGKLLNYIKFSMSREDLDKLYQANGLPPVQGAIDCTHVALRAPPHNGEIFQNRKGFHFLNVQLLCDHRQMILAVNARYPGSCHDAFILRETTVPQLFKPPHEGRSWLLGDKGYGVAPWLMTPLCNPTTPAEQCYNTSHTTTRAIIEQTIRVLKQRFHCLDCSGRALQYSPHDHHCLLHAAQPGHYEGPAITTGMDDPPQKDDDDDEEDEDSHRRRRQPNTATAGRAARHRLIAHRFQ